MVRAFDIDQELNNRYGISILLLNMGGINRLMKDYDEAFKNLEGAISFAKEISARDVLKESYREITELYKDKHDYQKALETFTLYATIKDSIFNESKTKQILELQIRYETEKKEKEIEILNKENTIRNLKLERTRYLWIFIILTFIVIIVIGFIFYTRYRIKARANKLLGEKIKLGI